MVSTAHGKHIRHYLQILPLSVIITFMIVGVIEENMKFLSVKIVDDEDDIKDIDAAGKTGTSQEHRDGWFVGYSSQLVAGVWFGNDDFTPMEFVVMVLQEFFQRDLETATHIMLKIHHEGRGVCGVYTKDVAATKVELVLAAARRAGHPLQCIMEAA